MDRAALHGILKKIRDLDLPLLLVDSDDSDMATRTDTDHITIACE
jgi:hypothetical protein